MGLPVVANVVAWVALAGGVGWVATRNADLERRIDGAEASLAAGEARETGLRRERDEAQAVLAAAPRPVEAGATVEDLRKDVQALWAQVLGTPGGPVGGPGAEPVGAPADLEAAVRDAVAKDLTQRGYRARAPKEGAALGKKPKFRELAKHLELDPDQSARLEQEVRDAQMRLYEVLSVPRADGVVLLDEIAQAEQYPPGSPQKTEPFLKLFKLKIPDTEETYVERAIALVQELKGRAPEYLAVEQMETLGGLDLDWFGIKFD
jgi:hypothetical protein